MRYAHGLEPEAEFSNFLALQISNAVSQTFDSNKLYVKIKLMQMRQIVGVFFGKDEILVKL